MDLFEYQGKQLFAYWFTTDAAGKPVWVVGSGPVSGNRAVLSAKTSSAAPTAGTWGKLTVSFSDCTHGSVQFSPNDPRQSRGQTSITRISDDSAKGCTGGISDDRHGGSDDTRIVQFFTNTGVVPAASGKARFEERSDRTDFKVEAEDLPIGTYSLRVAGTERATMDVSTSAAGTQAEVEFRSPVEPGKILLDFDPRGEVIDIAQGDTVFLTTTLADSAGGGGGGGDDGGGSGGSGGGNSDRYELRIELANDGPELKARLDDRPNSAQFNVELEDFVVGSYVLNVGGVDRGTIDVVAVPGGTEGEIEFRDPPQPNHFPLDFDPRGEVVEILSDGAVVLSGTFPTQPNGGGGGHGGGGGGGNDDPPGDDHGGGGGNDDPPGDDHGGGGGGNDDPPGDDHGGHHGGGNDDPPGDDHGGHHGGGHP